MALPFLLTRLLVRSGLLAVLPSVRRQTDSGTAYLRYGSDRLLAAPHAELADLAALLEPHGGDVIDLAAGFPRFNTPPLNPRLTADRDWPPPAGLPELRAAVAERLLSRQGLTANPDDEVYVTPGAAGAFSLILDTFVNPGDGVALFDPASPLFTLALRHRRARPRWIPSWAEDGRLRFRPDHLERALRRTKLLIVNSPHNPTGGVLAPEDLEQIAWQADRHDVLVCSDEVFERCCYEGDAVSIGVLPRARQRTLTVGSVSKGHALASLRVGWLAGCRHLVRPCAVTAALQAAIVPTLTQEAALAALRQGEETFAPVRAELEARRRYAQQRLQGMGLRAGWPAGGFFFWVPVWELRLDGRTFAERLLRAERVRVLPGDLFGPSGTGYVRISFASEDGRLREGLARLGDFLREQDEGAAPLRSAA